MKSAKLSGVLLVGKPAGMTSNDVLTHLKHVLRTAWNVRSRDLPKVGHTGTLDPFATGMLPVVVGQATRVAQFLLGAEKSYRGVIRFGVCSPSHDPDTTVVAGRTLPADGQSKVEAAARSLLGTLYLQTPPMFSAKRIAGERLYDVARRCETVARDAVPCRVHQITCEWLDADHLAFRVRVSSGTFIRVLAVDLAERVGADAILESLHRECVGAFPEARMIPLAAIEAAVRDGTALDTLPAWFSLEHALAHLPHCVLTAEQAAAVQQGQQSFLPDLLAEHVPQSPVALFHDATLIAIATADTGIWRLACVVL